jgi:hypothetical protein
VVALNHKITKFVFILLIFITFLTSFLFLVRCFSCILHVYLVYPLVLMNVMLYTYQEKRLGIVQLYYLDQKYNDMIGATLVDL